jgi:hypothetical protein
MNPDSRLNILVLYEAISHPLRTTIKDHLYSFARHSGHRCFYLNLAFRKVSPSLARLPFDLIIFHTTFLSSRAWNPQYFRQQADKIRALSDHPATKVALPQDEFLNTDLLCEFINRFGVTHVFSVLRESEWRNVYRTVDHDAVSFHRVLTGYLEAETLARIRELAGAAPSRSIDIGYRAWRAAPWLGSHGALKVRIADAFSEAAPRKGLTTDISTREKDTLPGDRWYEFLLKCRYTIGVEGGAGILDRDGSIRRRTEEFMRRFPDADFAQIEARCFPGLDGTAQLQMLSPRHLEACATRTCQVLIEGEYNQVLEAGRHYISLRRDLGNLEEVLGLLKEDSVRTEITERAYRDVVESGRYTYEAFARRVVSEALGGTKPHERAIPTCKWTCARLADRLSWLRPALQSSYGKSVHRSSGGMGRALRLLVQAVRSLFR